MLLIKGRDCNLSSKDLIKKIVSNPESNKCMMHGCESCLCTATLKENLDQKLSELENEGHYRSKNISSTYEEYKETLIVVIDDLTRHSCVAKPKMQEKIQSYHWSKNDSSYIAGHYLRPDVSLQDDSLCFICDDSSHYTSFLYEV